MAHNYSLPGWSALNQMGAEYALLYAESKGILSIHPLRGVRDTRTPAQKDLANEIVTGTYPFLRSIGRDLLDGSGFTIPCTNGSQRTLSAARFRHFVSSEELAQEGALALLKSLHRYESEHAAISTFIAYTAAGPMRRYAERKATGLFTVPDSIVQSLRESMYLSGNNMDFALNEIQETLSIEDRSEAGEIYHALTGHYDSLEEVALRENEDDASWYIVDENAPSPFEHTFREIKLDEIEDYLSQLSERQSYIIRRRYSLDGERTSTLEELAFELGITRERVRQIQFSALDKIEKMLLINSS